MGSRCGKLAGGRLMVTTRLDGNAEGSRVVVFKAEELEATA